MIDLTLAVTVLADGLLAEETNRGPDFGKASPVGLLIVVLLVIAGFFLVRSMNRQLRKVPPSFDPTESGGPASEASADDGVFVEEAIVEEAIVEEAGQADPAPREPGE